MEMTTLLDAGDFNAQTSFAHLPYSGCLSIAVLAHSIVCAMPQFIEFDEIVRPLSPIAFMDFVASPAVESDEFDPPLLASGHFSAIASQGTLPPLQWDDLNDLR